MWIYFVELSLSIYLILSFIIHTCAGWILAEKHTIELQKALFTDRYKIFVFTLT